MTSKLVLIAGSLLFPLCMSGQDPSDTLRFVNIGKMAIAPNGNVAERKASLFVPNSVKMASDVSRDKCVVNILQEGTTSIGGNFYQDATGHVFMTSYENEEGQTVPVSGTISFSRNNQVKETRFITTQNSSDIWDFNRKSDYVAFPHILIATDDIIKVPGRMGLDAIDLKRDGNAKGILYLQSEVSNDAVPKVYDASLRLTGAEGSEELAPAGTVIVERDLSTYRPAIGSTDVATYPLFAFASPMINMKSGYFAGNWVRKMLEDDALFGHVQLPYGNKDENKDHIIDRDQLVWQSDEALVAGKAYLIKPRPEGYDYSELTETGGLVLTGIENPNIYRKGKFVFDGNIYDMQKNFPEQLFAGDVLFSKTVNSNNLPTTLNWVIGNSWTSAIDLQKLVTAIEQSDLWFEPYIYLYPQGSTTYQIYALPGASGTPPVQPIETAGLNSIPSQSIFMLRVLDKNGSGQAYNQNGTFTIDRSFQVHSAATHNTLRSSATPFQEEVLFRITPENNPNIFDLAAVGIRQGAKETIDPMDIYKAYATANPAFQLYSLSVDEQKLSANVVPVGTKNIKLCLDPGETGGRMKITATRTESIEAIWLEDLLTKEIIDLKEENTYSFESSPKDTPERFVVHFEKKVTTGVDKVSGNFLQCYYADGCLVVKGLEIGDMGSTIGVYDIQGRILQQTTVNDSPEIRIPVSLSEGIYIAKLQGKRNITTKFRKGEI